MFSSSFRMQAEQLIEEDEEDEKDEKDGKEDVVQVGLIMSERWFYKVGQGL